MRKITFDITGAGDELCNLCQYLRHFDEVFDHKRVTKEIKNTGVSEYRGCPYFRGVTVSKKNNLILYHRPTECRYFESVSK